MDQGSSQFVTREPGRVGERLAAARQALGLSIDDIAERTRVPKRHLAAIERGSTEGLPALTYSAGFVRSYARLVGLDPEACAQDFRAEMGQPMRRDAPEPYEPADPARIPSRLLAIVALLLVVVIAGGYAIWRGDGLFGGGAEARERIAAGTDPALYPPSEQSGESTPAPQPAPPAAPAVSTEGPVAVTATEDAWVRILDGERRIFTGIMAAGKRIEIPADAAAPTIRTSRAQSLKITVGQLAIDPLGPPDTLVRAASLKREDLLKVSNPQELTRPAVDNQAPATPARRAPRALPPAFADPAGAPSSDEASSGDEAAPR